MSRFSNCGRPQSRGLAKTGRQQRFLRRKKQAPPEDGAWRFGSCAAYCCKTIMRGLLLLASRQTSRPLVVDTVAVSTLAAKQ